MKMKPILFNTEMVRAIQDGRKTVTRRLMKPQPKDTECKHEMSTHNDMVPEFCDGDYSAACRKCGWGISQNGESVFQPPYVPGDILYVRETFMKEGDRYYYRADFESDWLDPCETLSGGYPSACRYRNCDTCCAEGERIRWKPSIHMPKEAARIFLRVKSVRVERLQNITEGDAIKEGVPDEWPMEPVYCPECQGEGLVGALHPGTLGYMEVDCPYCEKAIKRFENLWNSTMRSTDRDIYGWAANPWVWVIEFEKYKRPEEV